MRALALVESPNHVCCRYRVRAFEPALRASGVPLTIQGLPTFPFARLASLTRASRFDVVLLQRKLLPGWQFRILRRAARRLIFDFDDAVLYRDSNDPRGPNCPRRAVRFARTVRQADLILAGNDFLADRALRAGATMRQVHVVPTCVEPGRYPEPKKPRERAGLELVWIGSSSTLKGLERRKTLWRRVGQELPGIRLKVVCDRFPDFAPLMVVNISWDEATEAAEIAQADVGVSWIPDDLWSRGKCGLKVLQYQAAGLPVIANRVGVHHQMIKPGISGLFAEDDDEWIHAIGVLARDRELRERMGQAAQESVAAHYSVSAWSARFVGLLMHGQVLNARIAS